MNKQVEEYIEKQNSQQKEIIKEVRKIFNKTLPDSKEEKAWGVIVIAGGKFYIAAMKTRVHVGFSIVGLDKEEINLFEGTGKTMRHVKIHSIEDIDEGKLVGLIKLIDKKASCVQS